MDETRSKGVRTGTGGGGKGNKNKAAAVSIALAAAILCVAAVALIAYDGGSGGGSGGAPGGSGGAGGGSGGEDLSAATHSLIFDVDGGTPIAPQAVFKGETAHKPSDPAKAGMEFAGWYRDASLSVPWSFDDKVTGDTVLYAKWASESRETGPTFKVSFDTGIAPALPDVTGIAPGSRMVAPATAMDGYRLNGWYKDEALTERWDFSTDRVTCDSTLYAGWERVYTVRYHFPDAAVDESKWRVATAQIAMGETHSLPDPGTRDPYAFGGWFKMVGGVNYSAGYGGPSDNLDPYPDGEAWSLDGDMDLYAYWKGSEGMGFNPSYLGGGFAAMPYSTDTGAPVVIQEYYLGLPVITIDSAAFRGCANLPSVSLPHTLIRIDTEAFKDCSSLTSIDVPSSVTAIGYSAFQYSGLKSVTIPSGVAIGNYAFHACAALESASLSAGVAIGKYAFQNSGLKSVTIPSGAETEFGAFMTCRSMTSVTISPGVKTIGEQAFYDCNLLNSISLPSGLETIEARAFSGSGVNATAKNVLEIPSSVKRIGNSAFVSSPWIEEIKFAPRQTAAEGLVIEDGAFANCRGIEKAVILPSGLKKIGGGAFANCINIPSVFIPDTVEEIAANSFPPASSMTSPMTIYVQASSIPQGWAVGWDGGNVYRLGSARPQ
ncbi:MAG: leucine-rich repeat protein [Candidatus Methanoplasma sp.]|jgi:uncharacterized repeat protein (TIGR02543 family)|nr:leucine-rich repeat protein [Candidatus Methanoplasma sp.]